MTLDVLVVPPLPCERWISIERYVAAIAANAGEDAQVTLASPPAAPPGVTGRYRARYREYAELLACEAPAHDVVHIPDQALAHLADAFPASRVVVTCHDLMPLLLEQSNHDSRFAAWFDLTLLRRSVASMIRASAIVTVSETTKRDLVALLDVDPGVVSVVPNVLHPAYREPSKGVQASERRLPPHPRVLSVGRAAPYKNVESLLEALAEPPLTGVSLVRVGEPLTYDQRSLAASLGVLERTVELGHLEPEDLAAVYSACDVLVQPSLYEGFGVPVIEAMACGLPVVCSDGGALPEVAGHAATVVPLASANFSRELAAAIECVVCEPATAATMRVRGLARANDFRPQTVVPRLLSVYHDAIKEHAA